MVIQVTHQCSLCLQTNPNNIPKPKTGQIGKVCGPGQQWQIDLTELPSKVGYQYLFVLIPFQGGQKLSLLGQLKLKR